MWVLYPGQIGIEKLYLLSCGERNTREPREKPLAQGENQQQTQQHNDTGPKLIPGNIGGSWRGELSHHCAIPAP